MTGNNNMILLPCLHDRYIKYRSQEVGITTCQHHIDITIPCWKCSVNIIDDNIVTYNIPVKSVSYKVTQLPTTDFKLNAVNIHDCVTNHHS